MRSVLVAICAWLWVANPVALAVADDPSTNPDTVAAAQAEGSLVIHAATDLSVAKPLLDDFSTLYPRIRVQYREMHSSQLHDRFLAEVAAGGPTADLLWSSAMDLQMKLANDGFAQGYVSPEARHVPAWATWKNEAFGTTYEPLVFVYNRELVAPDEVPQSHAELIRLLKAHPQRYRGKLTSYDPAHSGIGFLVMTQDARTDPLFWQKVRTYGNTGIKLYMHTSDMLDHVRTGDHLIAFNVLGSYAARTAARDKQLAVVYPKDYTLVISRIAIIPRTAPHPNAAKLFIDYLLSRRGQRVVASNSSMFSIRPGINGDSTATALSNALGTTARPIPVSPSILLYQDKAKRSAFLREWEQALGGR
jgi:iron(III) transport system substrate-binding protein